MSTTSTPSRSSSPAPLPPGTAPMRARATAEAIGTFWLVLAGCGTAVLAGDKVGFLGVALAFGLSVLTMAYAVGHVSGGHFNPAVTVGLAVGGRFAWRDVPAYVVTQVVAGSAAGGLLYLIASGKAGFDVHDGFAQNGWGSHSPTGYDLASAAIVEIVLTAVFVWIIMGATDTRAPVGFAPIAIGLGLTLIHLISIPVDNTSVNPARSLAVAWYTSGALGQVWLFIVAPVVGAAIAGATYGVLTGVRRERQPVQGTTPR